MDYFLNTPVNIVGNNKLRSPQIEAYIKIVDYFSSNDNGEALVVLPTGTGKSGLVSIAPFGICKGRVLIVTPGLVTKQSIVKTQEMLSDNFWVNFDVIFNPSDLPSLCEYESDITVENLYSSNIVISNIHKLTSSRKNSLINSVPPDFFDMVIIDEAHHAPAQSWKELLAYFSKAKKLHVTGTPFRGDNQKLPGELIHETPLSEVMRDRYVKWLRKETVNASQLYFTMPHAPGEKFTREQILALKDKEWIEKSVALSKDCSIEVINHSISKLAELNDASKKIPHKILAVGCSISHAEDIKKWYEEKGLKCIIVHSNMEYKEVERAFKDIDNHLCQVVISVNMLMEGYDHRYLTILALFRPYRSINAFAQIVGRVLRAIPEEEIEAFEVDNNALIIYHQDIGLDAMWSSFQKEVDRGTQQRIKDYNFSDYEYEGKDRSLAGVFIDNSFISDQDSYLKDIDFNELFEQKRAEIEARANQKIDKLRDNVTDGELDEDDLALIKAQMIAKETRKVSNDDIDPNLISKRPELYRKRMRETLTKRSRDEATNILSDLKLDPKGTELTKILSRHIRTLRTDTTNDGTLVIYINAKLHNRFGPVNERDNDALTMSVNYLPTIFKELRSMLSC
ncbi:helicase [Pectobacterium betavasculorum]|uniref:Helicase n=1 Tax=Pectobacterium betavasculorum TaxID=55207 RepID=A0A093RSQ9_9GAMM|nr:DEAD/DEAH box helicase family protein [Pectobacterium betavasculorum]KFX06197.1 helicase [Pectobacterium betavasculorum]